MYFELIFNKLKFIKNDNNLKTIIKFIFVNNQFRFI